MVEKANHTLIPTAFIDPATQKLKDPELAKAVQAGIQAAIDRLPPVQDKLFLALTDSLVPGDVDTPEKLERVLQAFERAAQAIGRGGDTAVAAFIGDIAKFLGRAMIEFAGEQRQNALKDRMAAREAAKAELLAQAGSMEKAADKMMAGATTSLVMGVVSGAVSVAGSAASAIGTLHQIKSMASSMNASQTASKQVNAASGNLANLSKISSHVSNPNDVMKVTAATRAAESAQGAAASAQGAASKAFELASSKAQSFTAMGQTVNALGDMGRSGGAGADGIMQAEAKREEAEGARNAAEAQFAQQTADMKKELQDSMNEMIKQVINFLKELREAEVDAMRALTKV